MKKYLLLALVTYLFIGVSIFRLTNDDTLKIVACDVGQGDAILIIYQNTQVLVDGGPNNKVQDCLTKHVPFWDRTLEIVINTHPEADHATGLIDVLKQYKVNNFVKNNDTPSTEVYRLLEDSLEANGSRVVVDPKRLMIGKGMISFDIVKSKTLNSKSETRNLNLNSLVLLVKYRDFEALLLADIMPPAIEGVVEELKSMGIMGGVEYIKVPHHGSKNGLTPNLLELTKPDIAVISVGKNQWGHPHPEILEMLKDYEVKVMRTDEIGDVVWKVEN